MVRQISVPWWMQGVGAVIPFRFRAENIASVAPIKTLPVTITMLLGEVLKILELCFTLPMASENSELTFSALRRLNMPV